MERRVGFGSCLLRRQATTEPGRVTHHHSVCRCRTRVPPASPDDYARQRRQGISISSLPLWHYCHMLFMQENIFLCKCTYRKIFQASQQPLFSFCTIAFQKKIIKLRTIRCMRVRREQRFGSLSPSHRQHRIVTGPRQQIQHALSPLFIGGKYTGHVQKYYF